jgi:hypothetical protein
LQNTCQSQSPTPTTKQKSAPPARSWTVASRGYFFA